jgi:hypothetical protein
MTEKEKMDFENLTNNEFMIWANKELNNRVQDVEKFIVFVGAEIQGRKLATNVDKIALSVMQMAMNVSTKIASDISTSIQQTYQTSNFMMDMPPEVQKILADVLDKKVKDSLKEEHMKINKELNKEEEFHTKPK